MKVYISQCPLSIGTFDSNLFFFCCLFQAFAQLAPSTAEKPKSILTLPLQKIVFLLCNLLTLGVGLWKCRSMGLLPTGTGDWLAFETRGVVRLTYVS